MRARLSLAALIALLCIAVTPGPLASPQSTAYAQEDTPDVVEAANLGGKIVFFSGRDFEGDWPKGYDLYSVNPDGTGLTRLTTGSAVGYLGAPAVSPDGTQIIAASGNKLKLFGADGAYQGAITAPGTQVWVNDWSSTNYVLLTVFGAGGTGATFDEEIYTLNMATRQFRRLTNDMLRNLFASWSPDGKQIAYMSNYELWIMNADGSNKHRIYGSDANLNPESRDLDWSPDGKQIVFEDHQIPAKSFNFDFSVISPDGTGYRRITNITDRSIWEPEWSPDGKSIVFSYETGVATFRSGLAILDVATGAMRELTPEIGDEAPVWVKPPPKYAVSGRVVDHSGTGIPFVSIAYGSAQLALTDATGAYTITDLPAGSYTLAPSKPGYTFTPVSRKLTVPPSGTADFTAQPKVTITHIELTQAIQTVDDSVGLIANKPTLARVYLDCGPGCDAVPRVTGKLDITGPGGAASLNPNARSVTVSHPASWIELRGDLDATLNFTIPPNLVAAGNVGFTARSGAASLSVNRTVAAGRRLRVLYVPMPYQAPGASEVERPDENAMQQGATALLQFFPVAATDVTYEFLPGFAQVMTEDFRCDGADCPALEYLATLETFWDWMGPNWGPAGPPDRLYGWVSHETPHGVLGGIANARWSTANGFAGTGRTAAGLDRGGASILAHELGHLLNATELRHTRNNASDPACSGEPGGPNDNHPQFPNLPPGSIGDWGVTLADGVRLLDPATTYDFMSYCAPEWISAYNYNKLAGGFTSFAAEAAAEPQSPEPSAATRQMIVAGTVYSPTQTARLKPVFEITSPAAPDSNSGTDYCLELRNASNGTLDKRCFNLGFTHPELGTPIGSASFARSLPYPAGARAVVLTHGGVELARAAASANAPVVQMLSPNGGENWGEEGSITVRWQGSDADGDALHYAVFFSKDNGATWQPIALDTVANELTLDAAAYPGATKAKIKVIASDGFLTGSDTSDGSFTVAKKGPVATILSPEESALPGAPLLLQGYGYDLESGALDANALSWHSDRSGELGKGRQRVVTLPNGPHVITLAATDADGRKATAQVTVMVGARLYAPLIRR